MERTNKIKFFVLLLVLTTAFSWAAKGVESKWDGRKYCTNMECLIGTGVGYCTDVCAIRGWTNGQCIYRPGQTGPTGYCCCWTP
ncbi:hypothetical protein LXL04_035719 [Taraxacum kok-saghyz]